MFSSFLRTNSEVPLAHPALLGEIAKAMKEAGFPELAAVDVAVLDINTLFSPGGRLAKLNICGVGESNQKINLYKDQEPLRFVIEGAQLDPAPDGKVVVICCSMRECGGTMRALIFSKCQEGLTFQESRFLATA